MLRNIFIFFFAAAFIAASSTAVFACACCAERGTYIVWSGPVERFQIDLLREMKFADKAELYMTEAGFDAITGIKMIEADLGTGPEPPLDIVDAFTGRSWTLQFKTPTGRVGSLILPRPARITVRKVDYPDNAPPTANVVLYKEFIFTGRVRSGSGFFKASVSNSPKFTLIFMGRGNGCDNAEDFTNWRLEVEGTKADYAFFGILDAAKRKSG